jgi:hypothetical protein
MVISQLHNLCSVEIENECERRSEKHVTYYKVAVGTLQEGENTHILSQDNSSANLQAETRNRDFKYINQDCQSLNHVI